MSNRKAIIIVIILSCLVISACNNQHIPIQTSESKELETILQRDNEQYEPYSMEFAGYMEYLEYVQGVSSQNLDCANVVKPRSAKITAYIDDTRNNPKTIMVPCYNGEPLALRSSEGYSGISVMEELYGFVWTWFYTDIQGKPAIIRLSKMSEKHVSTANGLTYSAFLSEIAPTAPNITNYQEKENYTVIFEKDLLVDAADTSVLVSRTCIGEEYHSFIKDGYLVIISAPLDTVTNGWLNSFSLEMLLTVGLEK